jgi:hypothetical protein
MANVYGRYDISYATDMIKKVVVDAMDTWDMGSPGPSMNRYELGQILHYAQDIVGTCTKMIAGMDESRRQDELDHAERMAKIEACKARREAMRAV